MNMKSCFLFFWVLTSGFAEVQSIEARQNNCNTKKGIAMEGYDPISYFDNKPKKGESDIHYQLGGATHLFGNTTNLEKFKKSPEKYEPAYGGWCAFAMGDSGEKAKIDWETYKIVDGKMYLFYNFWGNNTLTGWNKNESLLKIKADLNWKKYLP